MTRPLPTFADHNGRIFCYWRCESWRDRLQVLLTGGCWLEMNSPYHPVDFQSLQARFQENERIAREREQVTRWKVGEPL